MAFGATVQSVEGSTNATGTVTLTFTAAVAGNLLVAGATRNSAVTGWTTPSGYTLIHDSGTAGGGNMASVWYYKIAAGGETTVTMTHVGTSGSLRGVMAEFEGAFAASPEDVKAEDETNLATVVTSQTSGTTGTTAQADELAVGFWGADTVATVETTRTYTNSFTEVIFPATNTSRACAFLAKKILSATGTVESTFACVDTGDEMYGSVCTWKKAAAGTTWGPLLGLENNRLVVTQ